MYVTCESKCVFEKDENESKGMLIYGINVWSNVFESQIYDVWESKVIHSYESEVMHLFIICESKRIHMYVTCESKCISILKYEIRLLSKVMHNNMQDTRH